MSLQAIEAQGSVGSASRSGDLDVLFRLYARELNGFAFRRLHDREAAADVVQDGFLRFFVWQRGRENPPTRQDARCLLWSVVGNLTIDVLRQKRRRGTPAPIDAFANLLVDEQPTPERILESRQAYRLLKLALDEAPEVQRTALLLNRIDGLTHNQIAAQLGVSPSMVSKYIMAVIDRCLLRIAGDTY